MDIYCTNCGEPYELWIEDDEDRELIQSVREGRCPVCKGEKPEGGTPFRATLAAEMGALLGDDLDGLASMMDDAEYIMGGETFWGE